MQFKEDELVQYAEMVWTSFLGLEALRSHEAYCPEPTNVEACVQISGAWVGVVTLNCPETLSHKITEIMFQLSAESASLEEVQDAMGEIINMIGGNLKSVMPPPCHLSLPIVAVNGHSLHFPMTQIVCRVTMQCLNQLFQVTILKQKESNLRQIRFQ